MNLWFSKFRISAALDSAKPWPRSLERKVAGRDELRRFSSEAQALDSALKQAREDSDAPPGLHASIMRAVLRAPASAVGGSRRVVWRRLAAPAIGLAACAVAWWVWHQPPPPGAAAGPPSLTTATRALDLGSEVTQAMPAAVVAPMSDELARVRLDLDQTTKFLLASLP